MSLSMRSSKYLQTYRVVDALVASIRNNKLNCLVRRVRTLKNQAAPLVTGPRGNWLRRCNHEASSTPSLRVGFPNFCDERRFDHIETSTGCSARIGEIPTSMRVLRVRRQLERTFSDN